VTIETADGRNEGASVEERRLERAVKLQELEVRRREAEKASLIAKSPWWRRADPLVMAVLASFLALIGNMVVAVYNNNTTTHQEEQKNANVLEQQKQKAKDDLALATQQARYTLILRAIATSDLDGAQRNINFFIDSGLLDDQDHRIAAALEKFKPVLPAAGGSSGVPQPLPVPDIAKIYNFPPGLDGAGQTVGILEFGGGYREADLATYFAAAHLPKPDVTSVSVDGAANDPNSNAGINGQVTLNVEIIGSLAPKAAIRVYFAPLSDRGFVDAIKRATADHVSVISIGWGSPESEWSPAALRETDAALKAAAGQGITVVVAAGDGGVTDLVKDGHRHVDFPASSPWVLAVGGTETIAREQRLVSEIAWSDKDGSFATGGGVSDLFSQPDWQAHANVPLRNAGSSGRGVPDVAAVASPKSGALLVVDGKQTLLGGTSISAPIWAGLILLMNQGLGHNVGYLTPRLYQEIGPAGVMRAITEGDNSIGGVKGYSAGPGWNAVAGWGSPDGTKLLNWLRTHP